MKRNYQIFIATLMIWTISVNGWTDGGTSEEGLRDIKGPVHFPGHPWLWILGCIVVLAAVVFMIIKRRMSKPKVLPQEPADTRLPWEIAFEQFDALERESLMNEGRYKDYYSRLSGIIREYFERRFHVHAPEMTTEEFLWSLERSDHLTREQNGHMKRFLDSCDIVKFAKHIPGIEEGRESMTLARTLVSETKQDISRTGQP